MPLPPHRGVAAAPAQVPRPGPAADGQHEDGVRPPAGGRVRPCPADRRRLAVLRLGVPEPAAARPGVPRPGRAAAGEGAALAADVQAVPQARHLPGRQAAGAEVAAAHGPRAGAEGDVPGRRVRPHHARPVRRLPVDGEAMAHPLRPARPPDADVCRAGGARPVDLRPHVRPARRREEAARPRAVLRAALRGPGARPGRRAAEAVRPPRPRRLRPLPAAAGGVPRDHQGLRDEPLPADGRRAGRDHAAVGRRDPPLRVRRTGRAGTPRAAIGVGRYFTRNSSKSSCSSSIV